MIGVIDPGAGNLASIMNALGHLNVPARFVRSPEELAPAASPYSKIIFPGDGHFGTVMDTLNRAGYSAALRAWIASGRPFLGICIGMQILFDASEEAPGCAGLGIIKGTVKKFPGRKIPQIGWNLTRLQPQARPGPEAALFTESAAHFYYIHSYYCEPENDAYAAAFAHYGLRYCSAVKNGALTAVQFHPEKSGEAGLALLDIWLRDKSPHASGAAAPPPGKPAAGTEHGAAGTEHGKAGTLTKRVIPCLDVDDGQVVKGVKFKEIIYAGNPVELARRYNAEGADELTFLDIGASYKSRATLLEAVRQVAAEVFIPLCVGGGIRSVDDMRLAMNAGADKVSVCTSALERPALLTEMAAAYGSQCVVLSIDAKRTGARWNAFAKGGRVDTGKDAVEWAREAARRGAGEILLNSIDADGTGAGYDLNLTRAVMDAAPIPVIASGGAGTLEQISAAAAVADAVLAASLLHFGKTTIHAIKTRLRADGLPVRASR